MRLLLLSLLLGLTPAWAKLTFEKEIIDLEVSIEAEKATVDFKFKNTGDKAVKILQVDKTCICLSIMVKDGKLVYQPGEEGLIRTEFNIGIRKGLVEEVISLYLEGDAQYEPSHKLTARILIPELITMEPKTLHWKVGAKAEPQLFKVTILEGHQAKITETTTTSDNYEVKVEAVKEGQEYKLWVTPKDTSAPGIAVIGVKTDSKLEDENEQQGFAMVERPK